MHSLGIASKFGHCVFRKIFSVLKLCNELQLNWFLPSEPSCENEHRLQALRLTSLSFARRIQLLFSVEREAADNAMGELRKKLHEGIVEREE